MTQVQGVTPEVFYLPVWCVLWKWGTKKKLNLLERLKLNKSSVLRPETVLIGCWRLSPSILLVVTSGLLGQGRARETHQVSWGPAKPIWKSLFSMSCGAGHTVELSAVSDHNWLLRCPLDLSNTSCLRTLATSGTNWWLLAPWSQGALVWQFWCFPPSVITELRGRLAMLMNSHAEETWRQQKLVRTQVSQV